MNPNPEYPTVPQDPTELQAERDAAADLLAFAYLSGDPQDIAVAHELVDSLLKQDQTPKIIRLGKTGCGNQRPQHCGGLRRVSLTSGRMDTAYGTPKAWQSPHEQ